MAPVRQKLSADIGNTGLWLDTMKLTFGFLVALNTVAFIAGVRSAPSTMSHILVSALGMMGQAFIFKSRFFASNVYQKSVETRDSNAVFFGQRFSIKRRDTPTWSNQQSLRAVIGIVAFCAACYLLMSLKELGTEMSLSSLIIGFAVMTVMTPLFVWIPIGLSVLSIMMSGPPPNPSLLYGIIYAVVLVLLLISFSSMLHNILMRHATDHHPPLASWVSIDSSLKNLIKFGIIVTIISYAYCHWAAKHDENKSVITKNHKRPHEPSVLVPATGDRGLSSLEGSRGEGSGNAPSSGGYDGGSGDGNREGEASMASSHAPNSDHQPMESGNSPEYAGSAHDQQVNFSQRDSTSGGPSGGPSGGASKQTFKGEASATTPGLSTRTKTGELFKELKKVPKPKDIAPFLLTIAVFTVILIVLMMRKPKNRPDDLTQKSLSALKHTAISPEHRRRLESELRLAAAQASLDPESMRNQVVALYNQLLDAFSHTALHRPPAMTPDEYGHYFSAARPPKASAIRFVTDVYCRVFFGKQTPDRKTFESYLKAIFIAQSPS